MIVFENLHKSFGTRGVLTGVDLTIETRQITFIIGTSGTGKSVLMKHAVGLLVPDAGACSVDGARVDPAQPSAIDDIRRICSYVFQSSALLDSMTLAANVMLPLLRHRGMTETSARAEARRLLDEVGAGASADRHPSEVGGGVRKQAAIARALALQPRYLILDEPTTSLDPLSARRIDRLCKRLARETGVTVVVVSHDLKSIFDVADRVVYLHQGRVRVNAPREALRAHPDPALQAFLQGRAMPREEMNT